MSESVGKGQELGPGHMGRTEPLAYRILRLFPPPTPPGFVACEPVTYKCYGRTRHQKAHSRSGITYTLKSLPSRTMPLNGNVACNDRPVVVNFSSPGIAARVTHMPEAPSTARTARTAAPAGPAGKHHDRLFRHASQPLWHS